MSIFPDLHKVELLNRPAILSFLVLAVVFLKPSLGHPQSPPFTTIRGQSVSCIVKSEKNLAGVLQQSGRFVSVQEKLFAIERRIRILRAKRVLSYAEAKRLVQLRQYRKEWKSALVTAKSVCTTVPDNPGPFTTNVPVSPTTVPTEGVPTVPSVPTALPSVSPSTGVTPITSTSTPSTSAPTATIVPTSTPFIVLSPTATSTPVATIRPTPTLQPGTGGFGYPQDANIIDIVRDYKADPTGRTDSTNKIRLALREHNATSSAIFPVNPRTIYFPKGTYLISDTIFAESNYFPGTTTSTIRLLGEDRDGTVIKLQDNAPGFSTENPKYVLQTSNYGSLRFTPAPTPSPNPTPASSPQPNSGFGNYIEHLTIDTGSGNPAAVGVRFDVANMGAMHDVSIRSGDKLGKYGIQFFTNAGPGLVNRVNIDGFSKGIIFGSTAVNNIVFDTIRISNCAVGIENSGKNIQIHGLTTTEVPKSILTMNNHAVTILVDAMHSISNDFSPRSAPIEVRDGGYFFGRNIAVSNRFPAVIAQGTKTVVGVNQLTRSVRMVEEWSSQDATKGDKKFSYTLQGKTTYSLNLPIKDAPEINISRTPGYDSWANVTAPQFGAISGDLIDDTAAFQAAIDSGSPVIYVPYGRYRIDGTLHIRKNVERIDFLFSYIDGLGTIEVGPFDSSSTSQQVIVDNLVSSGGLTIQHQADRTVLIRNVKARLISSSSSASGDLFVENSGPRTSFELNGPPTWIRQMNREVVRFNNFGARVWVLGDNLEGKGADISLTPYPYQRSFVTTSGGNTEVLGGAVDALRYYARDRKKIEPLYSAVTSPQDTKRSRISVVAGSLEIPAVSGVTGNAVLDKDGRPILGSWDMYILDDAPPNTRVLLSDDYGAKCEVNPSQRRSFISLYSSE